MQSRVSRGFSRLALFLSAPPFVVSILLAIHQGYMWKFGAAPNPYDQFDASQNGVPFAEAVGMSTGQPADFTIPLVVLAFAILVYGLVRGLGWVVDGFARAPQV